MGQFIKIELLDDDNENATCWADQNIYVLQNNRNPELNNYPYILKKANKIKINLDDAIDRIIRYFDYTTTYKILVNLDEREKAYARKSAKEMTIEEIENALGYKIKIVKEKE